MEVKKVAIVTGGVRGIGLAIAHRLVEDGFFVVIADIDEATGKKSIQELGVENSRLIKCDISKEKEVKSFFESVIRDFGSVFLLVNNAAIIRDHMIHKMTAEEFDTVINVNLKGAWLMCREATVIMRKQSYGRIINISSRGWLGNLGQTNYAASKAGMIGMTRVLALELGRYNVFVNAIAPGLIDTPLVEGLPEQARQSLIQAQPTKCMGQPEDVAHAVAFLADERTRFITGQTIYVDGGKSIGAGI